MRKGSGVSISKLASYAAAPDELFTKADPAALRYGNKAHNNLGKAPSFVMLVILAVVLLALAKWLWAL